ncbi:MAG: hypothetical protein RBT74_05415 [Tenuifilaceae bacterium]|jgi:hypothetical protein|nr:hypothetical protein [Tenuifilaceae bacterium]
MDKLQTFIDQNRQLFDNEDPPRGHFDRFSSRLATYNSPKRVSLWLVASVAAVAGLLITASLSLLLNYSGLVPPTESGLATANLSPELLQIDEYYQYQVTQKQQLINKMMTGELKPFEGEISQALSDMNESYSNVLNDIALSPHTESAAFVLTRYYQAQLDVLDGIISRMQTVYTFRFN